MDNMRGPLESLIISADHAYKRARRHVYDQFPAGIPVDMEQLTQRQCQILLDLRVADAAIAAYREDQYATA